MQATLSKKITLAFTLLFGAGLLFALLIMAMELLEDGNFAHSWPIAAISTGGLLATFLLTYFFKALQKKRTAARANKAAYQASKPALNLR